MRTIYAATTYHFSAGTSSVFKVDAASGRQSEIFTYPDKITSITSADGMAYFVAADNSVNAIDLATNEQAWQAPCGTDYYGKFYTTGWVTCDRGLCLAQCQQERILVALDAKTGRLQWQQAIETVSNGFPLITPDVVYLTTRALASDPNFVWKLRRSDGAVVAKWQLPAGARGSGRPVLKTNGQLLVPAGDLFCLDTSTGAVVWSFPQAQNGASTPALAEGRVYFQGVEAPANGRLFAIDERDGHLVWKVDVGTDSSTWVTPTAYPGLVIGGSDLTHFANTEIALIVDSATGAVIKDFRTSHLYGADAILAAGRMYMQANLVSAEGGLSTGSGLFAIDPERATPVWKLDDALEWCAEY